MPSLPNARSDTGHSLLALLLPRGLGRDGAVEQADAADEAGASDGASQLIRSVVRTAGGNMRPVRLTSTPSRWMSRAATFVEQAACASSSWQRSS